jgi:hypothetical protein
MWEANGECCWSPADRTQLSRDLADDLIRMARRQGSLARFHDMEVVAANSIDGWPDHVGNLETWHLIADAAGVARPRLEWAGDHDIHSYMARHVFPRLPALRERMLDNVRAMRWPRERG